MATIVDTLLSLTEAGKMVWHEHTIPMELTWYGIAGDFRADINPDGVRVVKLGQPVGSATSEDLSFSELVSDIATQLAASAVAAQDELSALLTDSGPTGPIDLMGPTGSDE